ncbi:MAG: NAD-dependent DNA ligase LigA [Chitinophagales bacterium]|jgi:DNA ligase (NAD+)|nr:NAD-dependent DNA ligase LigA [Chitinophagales bacterium]
MIDLTNKLLKTSLTAATATEQTATETAAQLRQLLNYYDRLYYIEAASPLPDTDYDYLFDLLRRIEQKYPNLRTTDSPTQRVGGGLSGDFPTITHTIPMLSLDKAYETTNLVDFDTSVKKLTTQTDVAYTVEPKFDGSSVALIYENDLLVRAATRGDGEQGEDITANVRKIPTIPLSATFSKYGIYRAEVRGEIIINKHKFVELQQTLITSTGKTLANPRNAAAGALRLKDSSRVAERKLESFIYQLAAAFDQQGNDILATHCQTHSQNMEMMNNLGFRTPAAKQYDAFEICTNINEVIDHIDKWKALRDTFDYEIDGMVVKVDKVALQEQCGATNHHPKWAIAFKFDAKQAASILEKIDFQVGRTGAITPVAKLKPVQLAGVMVSSVSLHNEEFIRERDIMIGDTVLVERAGDVIPYITAVDTDKRTGTEQAVVFPTECPSCGSKLQKNEDESVWRCLNADCSAQVEERIIHFAAKDSMDIRGLGDQIIRNFYKDGLLNSIEDIYQLNYFKIQQQEGWGTKSVENLRNSIEASKKQPLHRLIIGLGIREAGQTTAKTLAQTIDKDLEELYDWTTEKLKTLPDVGPKVAANIVAFFAEPKNRAIIAKLKELGVNTQQHEDAKRIERGKLSGFTFLFTGSLQQFSRDKAHELVEQNGGKLLGSVSKNLNYLVVGENAGSKLDKAKKIPTINILTEDEFLALVHN